MECIVQWLCSFVMLILAIFVCCRIKLILSSKNQSTVDKEMLFEKNVMLKKSSLINIKMLIVFIVINIVSLIIRMIKEQYSTEDIALIHLSITNCISILFQIYYVVIYLKYPLIITEKYYIVLGSIYKNRAIKYFVEEDILVLIKQKRNGEQTKLLCIHINDTKTIIEIQKYAEQTENNLDFDNDD